MDGKHSQQFAYDRLDRVIKVVENIKNEKTYTTETVYDAFGRIKKEIYPDGYAVNNSYDSYGNLISVTDSYDNKIWQGLSANARGQLIKSKQGNTEKTQLYDSRGLPSSITAAGIIIMAYTFNDKGNLTSRSDLLTGHKEDFTYDTMNRLTAWDVSKSNVSQVNNSINYNPTTGTITTKSDVGFTFNYGEENGKPHALTSISGKPDRIPHSAQTITYTDFKKVKSISLGNKSLVLDYGVDKQRRKGVFKEENATFTRYYSGNYEEEISSSGKIKKIHYISGGDGLAGIYINDDGNSSFYSAYCDYQGSLLALTDINGVVKGKYAYDPWGNRRNPALWKDADTRTKFIIDRGYTLHEHLDALGLINMNGRVYDPLLGMFLSPDPYVQVPGNWLNYNRYGYCYGNPLLYTDPSGEFLVELIVGAIIGTYIGGSIANHSYNPGKWDYSSGKTWGYMAGGAIIGAVSGVLGSYVATSGMPMANTASMLTGSYVNSIGMHMMSGGQVPVSLNLGGVSYDMTNNILGYLGKKGNKKIDNWMYGLGGLGNLQDILAGMKPGSAVLRTENDPGLKKDLIGHTQLSDNNDKILIDWGPVETTKFKWVEATNSYEGGIPISTEKMKWKSLNVKNVNIGRLTKISEHLNEGGRYNLFFNSCVSQVSRALNRSGVFNIGIHPYLLHAQMYMRSIGFRPFINSYYFEYFN